MPKNHRKRVKIVSNVKEICIRENLDGGSELEIPSLHPNLRKIPPFMEKPAKCSNVLMLDFLEIAIGN